MRRRLTLVAAPLDLIASPAQAQDEQAWAKAPDVAVGGLVLWSVAVPLGKKGGGAAFAMAL
ncbi:hypothetical protein [Altererythrobacter sp. Root672]|uniref:hypothetical protein n=1 Tax=Altererythrobacter sp. Root672 TaxID=1736584 RepID=UPI0012E3F339|nr:hypothetical protein [Altererythrobacter sp. Root672]